MVPTHSISKAVIATVAEDRPGLISELSEVIHSLGLNIEDSRMTVLGGEFAVLMSVAGEEQALTSLEESLGTQAQHSGFVFLFRRTGENSAVKHKRFLVTISAMDHPGIVHSVTLFFSERTVNIIELTTEMDRAAHTGAPVFNLRMEIELPKSMFVAELQEAFADFCDERGLDGELINLH